LVTVIAVRRRIEERAKDPAQGASDDESQNIGEDAMETRPSADLASRNKIATDYSTSASFFLTFFPRQAPRSPKLSVMKGPINIEIFVCSDSIHDRRPGERGNKKPAAEIDISASTLSSAGRR
jgi:hypothetical protein